jgi:hypothetical protein
MQKYVFNGKYPKMIDATLAAAINYFEPYENIESGKIEQFVTLVMYHQLDPAASVNGAWFLIRRDSSRYDWGYIPSGLPDGDHLRGSRTVCKSPFSDEPNTYYFGGCFAGPSEQPPKPNMAWIYKGTYGTTSVNEICQNNSGIHISPNPASSYIEINLDNVILSEAKNPVKIYNTFGDCVMTESIHPMTSRHRINIEHLPVGLYFIQIGNYSQKFVVVR